MNICVYNKNLLIDDKIAEIMHKNYMDLTEDSCLHYLSVFYSNELSHHVDAQELEDIVRKAPVDTLSGNLSVILKEEIALLKNR
jgi:hypothetical protein